METLNAISQKDGSYLYKYYFRGSRNYVHGTTIFESFCSVLKKEGLKTFDVKDLKFYRELQHNGRIVFKIDAQEQPIQQEHLMAIMTFTVEEKHSYIMLLDDQQSKVVDRQTDSTADFIACVHQTGNYESECTLRNIKNFETFVTVFVEANKRTHVNTLNDTNKQFEFRWGFMRKLFVDMDVQFPEEINIRIKHLGLKTSKDNKNYTLNELNFSLGNKTYNPILNFAYYKK